MSGRVEQTPRRVSERICIGCLKNVTAWRRVGVQTSGNLLVYDDCLVFVTNSWRHFLPSLIFPGRVHDRLAAEQSERLRVVKVDTDANRDISIKYSISAIPTVILFKGGQVAQKFVGLRQERDFKEALDGGAK